MKANAGGKRALVTGSANGLGKALTEALLSRGWLVTGIDRETQGNENRGATSGFTPVECDLSDRMAVDALLEGDMLSGPFDLVVLNAAISATGRFENIPLDTHERLIRLNAETPMVMTASLAQTGRLASPSSLVFISSLSHFVGYPGAASYAASKDAIAVYARSIRKPFAGRGIRVSCAFPGPMATQQAERHAPAGAQPDKRMAPEFAARYILQGAALGMKTIIPGGGPKAFSLFGRMAPFFSDRAMRRIVFEKLEKDVF